MCFKTTLIGTSKPGIMIQSIWSIQVNPFRYQKPKYIIFDCDGVPKYLLMKLELTKLKSFFTDRMFHVRLVKKPKPAPDLFIHAANKLQWNAAECLVVEDSEHGVAAGKAAGMTVCGFLGGGHIFPGHADRLLKAGADFLISDFRHILGLIN